MRTFGNFPIFIPVYLHFQISILCYLFNIFIPEIVVVWHCNIDRVVCLEFISISVRDLVYFAQIVGEHFASAVEVKVVDFEKRLRGILVVAGPPGRVAVFSAGLDLLSHAILYILSQ